MFFLVLSYLFISGALLAFIMMLGNLFVKQRKTSNILFSVLLFCLGVSQFQAGFFLTLANQNDFHLILSLMLLASVSAFLFFKLMNQPDIPLNKTEYLLYLCVSPFLVFDALWYFPELIVASKSCILLFNLVLHWIGGVMVILLLLLGVLRTFSLYAIKNMTKASVFVLFISGYVALAIATGLLSLVLNFPLLIQVMHCLFFVLIVFVYLLSYRFPNLIIQFVAETTELRFAKTLLGEFDLSKLIKELNQYMLSKRVFLQDGLTLPDLAEMMELSPHQLSELINKHIGMNFNTYLNSFRINEAKQLLISQSNKTVLEIAFSVGFNNKTSFNEAFHKFENLTPTQFRKRNS